MFLLSNFIIPVAPILFSSFSFTLLVSLSVNLILVTHASIFSIFDVPPNASNTLTAFSSIDDVLLEVLPLCAASSTISSILSSSSLPGVGKLNFFITK